MEAMLRELFEQHDADGNGHLDRKEFESCLVNSKIVRGFIRAHATFALSLPDPSVLTSLPLSQGFSDEELNLLLDVFDVSSDGMMSYNEFVDAAYDVLADAAREKAIVEIMIGDE